MRTAFAFSRSRVPVTQLFQIESDVARHEQLGAFVRASRDGNRAARLDELVAAARSVPSWSSDLLAVILVQSTYQTARSIDADLIVLRLNLEPPNAEVLNLAFQILFDRSEHRFRHSRMQRQLVALAVEEVLRSFPDSGEGGAAKQELFGRSPYVRRHLLSVIEIALSKQTARGRVARAILELVPESALAAQFAGSLHRDRPRDAIDEWMEQYSLAVAGASPTRRRLERIVRSLAATPRHSRIAEELAGEWQVQMPKAS